MSSHKRKPKSTMRPVTMEEIKTLKRPLDKYEKATVKRSELAKKMTRKLNADDIRRIKADPFASKGAKKMKVNWKEVARANKSEGMGEYKRFKKKLSE